MAELRRLIRRRSTSQVAVVLEGPRTVAEAAESGIAPQLVAVPDSVRSSPAVAEALERVGRIGHRAEVLLLTDSAFKSLAPTVTPQPMLAVVQRPTARMPERLAPSDLVMVLVGVADPGNAGTIVRAAAACAARCVVTVGGADLWAPKAVRASAGAVLRVPVVVAADAAEALTALRAAGARVVASHVRIGAPYDSGVLRKAPVAVVLGSEARGLNEASLGGLVDEWARIPMAGCTESLNVAMAATLLAYEARRGLLSEWRSARRA